MSSSRNWLYAVGGAVAGTAAVIIAIAVVSQLNDDDPTPAASSSPSASESAGQPSESTAPTDAATDTPTSSAPTGTPVEGAVPVYYAGDSGRGTVLFREFQPGIGGDPVAQSAYATVAGPPLDPDYRTLWPAGTEATASYDGDVITVDLTGGALHDKPKGMSKRDAELAVQQVVYSVQGAAGERAGVQLLLDGERTDQVLGQPASEPLTNADPTTTLSMMNVTLPEEGMVVSGDTLGRRGRRERVRGDLPVGDPAGRPGRRPGLRDDRGVLRAVALDGQRRRRRPRPRDVHVRGHQRRPVRR